MANSKSAKKRIIQNEKNRLHNKKMKSTTKTAVKKVLSALEDNNLELAKETLKFAMKCLDKAAKANVIHKNNSARKKSQLARKVHTLETSEAKKTEKA